MKVVDDPEVVIDVDDDMDKDPIVSISIFSNLSGARAGVGIEKENINRVTKASSSRSEATSNRENNEGEGKSEGEGEGEGDSEFEDDCESNNKAEIVELVATDENNNEGSNIDDELRTVREVTREFLRRKRRKEAEDGFVEVPLGEVGYDQGDDQGDNKYQDKVGGDEKYYRSDD
ncbi:conserved hypothetical protein [Ricinus communis]|uniref:Uncharacterized protein n=1 Tax=Ricinus communis TaxID=3988 RepID=B9RHI0_RICCO|nr:conserved hypothetical protein [Ricinus communis]